MYSVKRNIYNKIILISYLFLVISIQLFITGNGQLSLPLVLSQLLLLTVLLILCPFLLQKVSQLNIWVREEAERKQVIFWGVFFFVTAFDILYFWYKAYYPGAFSAVAIDQCRQVLTGKYQSGTGILQTWLTFMFPIVLTGKAESVVLFQIAEYACVIAYASSVLCKYGGKRIAVPAFLYVMLNPVTGNIVVCPENNVTFAMFAILLMTFGLQIHITDGNWLEAKSARLVFILILLAATLVSPYGILFTAPFLIAVLFRIDSKKKVRILVLFLLTIDLIRGGLSYAGEESQEARSYEAVQVKLPITLEELQKTDMVYGVDGNVDWNIYPEMAENDLGMKLRESEGRVILDGYTEFSRNSIFKYLFWCIGVIHLLILIVVLSKCGLATGEKSRRFLFALPVFCYNFGIMLMTPHSDFRFFYMSFSVCPILLVLLLIDKVQESTEDGEETAENTIPAQEQKKERYLYGAAVCYTLILFTLNFVRAFNMNFWSDEGYSIMLSRMNFADMVNATAWDVHPPLYYAFLQIICRAMGFRWISYRLLSIIPYGIMLGFAITVIWKKFGKVPAIILVTLSSLLYTAVDYNVQARMYSWGALFVLMSFYYLHEVLVHNRRRDYAGFSLMSLGAAYTHYYCLISVAFFYVVLLLVALYRRKEYLLKTLITCVFTVVAYLPWFLILLQTFKRTTEGYWMTEIPTLRECLLYLFSCDCQKILLAFFLFITLVLLAYETGMLRLDAWEEKRVPIRLTLSGLHMNKRVVWLAAGMLSVFGTALTGIFVSEIFRPMFSVRYVYPVSAVAWLMLGIGLAGCKERAACMAVIICLVLKAGLPDYIMKCGQEKHEEDLLKTVLYETEGKIETDDVILTDVALLDWTIINAYYPGVMHQFVNEDAPTVLDENIDYWLFLAAETEEDKREAFAEQGYESVCYVKDGNLGRIPVCVYKLVKEK